jgi:Family of unknown function (DUF6489)
MKITANIDCTPAEAREFLGLPDLRPLQAAWLSEIEKRMIAEVDRFSPEALTGSWLSGSAFGADQLPNIFKAFLRQAAPQDEPRNG